MTKLNTLTKTAGLRVSRISWRGLLAGTLAALTVAFLLNLLGLGVGLTTIDPMSETNTFDDFGTGTIIWWVISNLIALFIGGWVSGRTAGLPSKLDGGIQGFLSWGLFLFISFFVLTSVVGSILSGMGSMVSSIFSGDNSKEMVVNMQKAKDKSESGLLSSVDEVKQQIIQVVQTAENYNLASENSTEKVNQSVKNTDVNASKLVKKLNLKNSLSEFVNDISVDLNKQGDLDISVEGDGNYIDQAKLKDYLANNTKLSEQEINGVIQKWEQKIDQAVQKAQSLYQKTKKKALKMSEKVSDGIGSASIYLFIALIIGAIASIIGGMVSSPSLTVEEEHVRETV